MPNCLMMERWTSASVTFSITWSRPRTAIELIHLVGAARETGGQIAGLCASIGVAGGPAQYHAVADALDLDVRIRIDCFSAARTPLRSRVTAMS